MGRIALPLVVLFVSTLAYYYHHYIAPSPPHDRINIDPTYRQLQIESIILQTWNDYKLNAWGDDIYHPLTPATSHNIAPSNQPLGWIIIDAIDTLLYIDKFTQNNTTRNKINKELNHIIQWCNTTLSYDIDAEVNVFETTIRMLGGLLSTYHLLDSKKVDNNNKSIFLNKAIDLAERLIPVFNQSITGIPYSSVNLHTGQAIKNHADAGASSTAEFTTLQLEFKYLSILTQNDKYWKLVESVYPPLYQKNNLLNSFDSLIPIYTHPDTAEFYGANIRFGSRGDSFYEYLLKQYLFTHEPLYYKLYRQSMEGMKRHLLKTTSSSSSSNGLVYIAERPHGLNHIHSSKMDHLVCFMGGLMAMGASEGIPIDQAKKTSWWDTKREEDWLLAQELTYTCYQMYKQTPTGLAPEIVIFNDRGAEEYLEFNSKDTNWWISPSKDFAIKPLDSHNLQRPETVESLMFLYHLTKDPKYRQWGAEILDSFIKYSCIHCDDPERITYTSLNNVINIPTDKKDNLESFWLAETLKYLYLLFQDDVDLTKDIFNTEAHPFPSISQDILTELNLTTGWSI